MSDKIGIIYDEDNIQSNIVSGEVLKKIQGAVLRDMKNAIIPSMGPAGSNTKILSGNDAKTVRAEYSKDGKKIINNIIYAEPIEMSIQSEVADICLHIEKTVGDGTSSAVALSSIIFDKLYEYTNRCGSNPFMTIREFQKAVDHVKSVINSHWRECTLDDIKKIAMISTNGNEEVSDEIQGIYRDFGMDVYVDVSASINGNSFIKYHDGISLEVGYADPAYINTVVDNVCRLSNPRIYAFQDPIDTPQMVSYFEKIAIENCMRHVQNPAEMIPTVIMTPTISRDMVGLMRKIISVMHSYNPEDYSQKPPFLVITNINGLNQNIYENITQLCGCKMIRKYIDDAIEKKDQESGIAPTIDTITEWYGTAEEVVSDVTNTLFYSPLKMFERNDDGTVALNDDLEPIFHIEYKSLIHFLQTELEKSEAEATEYGKIGSLKRQLNALKSNMVEYFVGGITMSDRDSLRDLVEDAVLNCRSAAAHGVGYGANYEGYRAVRKILSSNELHTHKIYYEIIHQAYDDVIRMLYSTVAMPEELDKMINETIENDCPCNISNMEYDHSVLSSITSDSVILDTISKIITIMFTSNQALIQSPHINHYH